MRRKLLILAAILGLVALGVVVQIQFAPLSYAGDPSPASPP
jgi:hypothetical protein